MLHGIGTDIVEIARIESAGAKKLAKKILTSAEIAALEGLSDDKFLRKIAKRFAAKEAISKAFGSGIGAKLAFHDIEISNDGTGKPLARIVGHEDLKIHLSISDEKTHAIAFAVIEK